MPARIETRIDEPRHVAIPLGDLEPAPQILLDHGDNPMAGENAFGQAQKPLDQGPVVICQLLRHTSVTTAPCRPSGPDRPLG